MSLRLKHLSSLCQKFQQNCVVTTSKCLRSVSTCDGAKTARQNWPVVQRRYREGNSTGSLPSVNTEVICPSSMASIQKFIVPTCRKVTEYGCPSALNSKLERLLPPLEENVKIEMPSSEHKPRKETSKIRTTLFWRHKRMKKQRLAVLRWRRLMIIRSHNIEKAKKRELRDQKEYSEIKKKAEDFDAEKYLQELLEDARRGGYKIDLFKRWHT